MIVRESGGVKVILVDRLPPEVLAKVQALYARRPESMEEHLKGVYAEMRARLVEILAQHDIAQSAVETAVRGDRDSDTSLVDAIMAFMDSDGASAAKFMDSWYVNYNHKSIGDCAVGGVLGVEGLSELACKALQHWGLFSGQQTSTRAVNVSLAKIVDPLGTPASRAVLDRWMAFYTSSQDAQRKEVAHRFPRQDGESEKDYLGAVNMRAFDSLRGWLPAGLTTQTSVAMNLRQVADHLTWLLVHPLEEVRRLARMLQGILRERYPSSGSFGGSAALSGIGTKGAKPEEAARRDACVAATAAAWTYQHPDTRPGSRYPILGGMAVEFSHSIVGLDDLTPYAEVLRTRELGCVLPRCMDDLGQATATFMLDWGAWRDIERQRAGVCRVPMLTTEYGFEAWYVEQLPNALAQAADELLKEQIAAIEQLTDDPLLRQYYIPFGFRVPTTLTYTLPIWVYVLELRTGPTVHPTLRRAMLSVADEFEREFNCRGSSGVPLFIDRSPDAMSVRRGRQTIEKRDPQPAQGDN